MRSFLFLTALCAAAFFGLSAPAHAQKVQRCTTLSGEKVYSDKHCEDIGAIDRLPALPSGPATRGSSSLYRGGCSRTLSDLVYQISAAIEAKDVNRLARVYQWSGISNDAANRILDRLQAVVNRPLVDIVPVRPEPLPELPVTPPMPSEPSDVADQGTEDSYPQARRQPRPTGLRLEQTLANGSTPSQTTFGLRRSYNCFWISL
jgi:hypothetical protein